MYTNDKSIHDTISSHIYVDDLCIAVHENTFEKIESALTDVVEAMDLYHRRNHLRANIDKTHIMRISSKKLRWSNTGQDYELQTAYPENEGSGCISTAF